MEIKITDATPDDVLGIQKVFHKTWVATYPNEEHRITLEDIEHRFNDAYAEERLSKRREEILTMGSNAKMLVAKDGQEVVGLCRMNKNEEKNQIHAIYVLPEYQGKGIGTMFWKEALNFFDAKKDIVVEVATYNKKAISFYSKLGFTDTGKRFTEDRLRMRNGADLPEMEMRIRG